MQCVIMIFPGHTHFLTTIWTSGLENIKTLSNYDFRGRCLCLSEILWSAQIILLDSLG